MSKMARELPGSGKTAPRAAAPHFSGDLDRQARLAVEGFHPSLREGRFDLEAAVCARWSGVMDTRHEEKPHGH